MIDPIRNAADHSRARTALAVAAGLLFTMPALASPTLQPPFDTQYTLTQLESANPDPVPGVAPLYAAIQFKQGDPNTLLFASAAYSYDGTNSPSIYSIGVTRDENNHINGFSGSGVFVALAPGYTDPTRGIGAGLDYGPESVQFYSSMRDNSLGEFKPGSTTVNKQIDLSTLSPAIIQGNALVFVPQGFMGAGSLKIADYAGDFLAVTLAADGIGTFDVSGSTNEGVLAGVGPHTPPGASSSDYNLITGLGYVSTGNPQFTQESLVTSSCDYDTGISTLNAYATDSQGNPVLESVRTMVSNLCATGMTTDPLTGDLLFTSVYGYPPVTVLSGFTIAPPAVEFSSTTYSVYENAGTATVTVKRYGNTATAATVHYATSPGTATSANYSDVSGTLNWPAGSSDSQTFSVPVKVDRRYHPTLTVNLTLSNSTGAALGAPQTAVLSILNRTLKK